jgi:hypothetical protein
MGRLARQRLKVISSQQTRWPKVYTNSDTGKQYQPHNDEEAVFVLDDVPRYFLLRGGEGAGKSSAGVAKVLNRIRSGQNGIMVSPDLMHFRKSLWPEFKRWCPWHCVIERQRYRQTPGWEPTSAFNLVFHNEAGGYSELLCGGCKESEIEAWEGPNVSFVHFDEARRHKSPKAIKVFDGRARIPGPNGEPPQVFLTTTPRKHWLYEYFGPLLDDDPLADFKTDSYVATVLTAENIANLEPGFVEKRAQSLSEAEARILLRAEWEDEEDTEKFVKMVWWDNCREDLPALSRDEPMVLGMDAAKGGETTAADCFAVVGVTRHPGRPEDVAVRYCGVWTPPPGGLLDFAPIEEEVRRLCREFAVMEVAYDDYQLHDLTMRLGKEGIANFRPFPQGKDRLVADKQLQDLIMARRVAHDGNPTLANHIHNANAKRSQNGIRIVKRATTQKVDAAVALAMAANRNLGYILA